MSSPHPLLLLWRTDPYLATLEQHLLWKQLTITKRGNVRRLNFFLTTKTTFSWFQAIPSTTLSSKGGVQAVNGAWCTLIVTKIWGCSMHSLSPCRNLSAWFLDWERRALCCCCCCCCSKEPPSCFWIPRPTKSLASSADPPIDCPSPPAWWSCDNRGFCEELKLGDCSPELDVAGVVRGSCPSWDCGFCTAWGRPVLMLPTAPRLLVGPSTEPVRGWGGNDGNWVVGVAGVVGRGDWGMLSPVRGSS